MAVGARTEEEFRVVVFGLQVSNIIVEPEEEAKPDENPELEAGVAPPTKKKSGGHALVKTESLGQKSPREREDQRSERHSSRDTARACLASVAFGLFTNWGLATRFQTSTTSTMSLTVRIFRSPRSCTRTLLSHAHFSRLHSVRSLQVTHPQFVHTRIGSR